MAESAILVFVYLIGAFQTVEAARHRAEASKRVCVLLALVWPAFVLTVLIQGVVSRDD